MYAEQKNPLRVIAIVTVVLLGLDLYRFINTGHTNWIVVEESVLSAVFLVFYIRQWRLAWVVSAITFAVFTPINFLILRVMSPHRFSPPRVVWTAIAIWVFCVVYIVCIRQRYYAYIAKANQDDDGP